MLERHWHWKFVAFNGAPDSEKIQWGVSVEVIGYLSEADARVAARDIVSREQCNLISVWECSTCGYQEATSSSMQSLSEKA